MDTQNITRKMIDSLNRNDIRGGEKFKLEALPSSLYRYRKLDNYAIDCLKRKSTWVSNYKELNDPFEGLARFNDEKYLKEYFLNTNFEKDVFERFGVRLTSDEIKGIRNSVIPHEAYFALCEQKITNYVRPDLTQLGKAAIEILEKQRTYFYVSCFSEKRNSLLMWSHYADSGRGICIEYNLRTIDHSYLHPVFYSNDIYDFSVGGLNTLVRTLYKGSDWKYEHEWRIVYMNDNIKIDDRHFNLPIPAKIFLGPRFGDNSIDQINELNEIAGLYNIPLIKTKLHSSEYGIVEEGGQPI